MDAEAVTNQPKKQRKAKLNQKNADSHKVKLRLRKLRLSYPGQIPAGLYLQYKLAAPARCLKDPFYSFNHRKFHFGFPV